MESLGLLKQTQSPCTITGCQCMGRPAKSAVSRLGRREQNYAALAWNRFSPDVWLAVTFCYLI